MVTPTYRRDWDEVAVRGRRCANISSAKLTGRPRCRVAARWRPSLLETPHTHKRRDRPGLRHPDGLRDLRARGAGLHEQYTRNPQPGDNPRRRRALHARLKPSLEQIQAAEQAAAILHGHAGPAAPAAAPAQPIYVVTGTPPGPLPPAGQNRSRSASAAPGPATRATTNPGSRGPPMTMANRSRSWRSATKSWRRSPRISASISRASRWFEFSDDEGWQRGRENRSRSGSATSFEARILPGHAGSRPRLRLQDGRRSRMRPGRGAPAYRGVPDVRSRRLLVGLPGGRVYDLRTGQPRRARLTDYVTRYVGFEPMPGRRRCGTRS